jgi:hypothetical protein
VRIQIPGYNIEEATAYSTTEDSNFVTTGYLVDTLIQIAPRSLNTVDLRLSPVSTSVLMHTGRQDFTAAVFPNPFEQHATIHLVSDEGSDFQLEVFDLNGSRKILRNLGYYPEGTHQINLNRNGLSPGPYLFRIKNSAGITVRGKFLIMN